jgi:hypothetical protein
LERKDTKLVEPGKSEGRESPTQTETLKDNTDNTALSTFDALPLTVVKTFVEGVEEFVV